MPRNDDFVHHIFDHARQDEWEDVERLFLKAKDTNVLYDIVCFLDYVSKLLVMPMNLVH